MISMTEARKIGNKACIDMLGRDFCLEHSDNGSSGHDIRPYDGKLECFVCVSDEKEDTTSRKVQLLERPFPYRCVVSVDMETGDVEYLEYITPDGRIFPKIA